jgi:hypothetical protein
LRRAYVAARQAEGRTDPAFRLQPEGAGWRATGALGARFDAGGVHFDGRGGLRVARYGCDGAWSAPAATAPEVEAPNRVRYARPGFAEWYAHGPLGIEQGFDVDAPRCGASLRVELALDGLRAQPDGDGARLVGAGGALRYTDAFAVDAAGRALPARIEVAGGALAVAVDTAGAAWPIAVDPLLAAPTATFAPDTDGDGGFDSLLGESVAIDGDTAVVSSRTDNVGDAGSQGSAYVFVRNAGVWTRQAKLVADDGGFGQAFGTSVAISGDTVLVGTSPSDGTRGAAYVFARDAGAWTQQAKLAAADDPSFDGFGCCVAVVGDTALVGARQATTGGGHRQQGAAYVFVRQAGTWTQQAQLTAQDGADWGQFGASVALGPDTAVVGATGAGGQGLNGAGAAYVFSRTGVDWAQQATLTASDAAAGDSFGSSVALSGDRVVVGADQRSPDAAHRWQGAAYVFVHEAAGWRQEAELTAPEGAASDRFGISVAIERDVVVVGAPFMANDGVAQVGAAYVFVRDAAGWRQQVRRAGPRDRAQDFFGLGVAVSGGTVLFGSPRDGQVGAGLVYVAVRDGDAWTDEGPLSIGVGAGSAFFGTSVAVSSDTAVVGAPRESLRHGGEGAVYVFHRDDHGWALQTKLVPPDEATGFGASLVLEGDTLLVGAPDTVIDGRIAAGKVYAFVRDGAAWTSRATLTAGADATTPGFGASLALSAGTLVVGAPFATVGRSNNRGIAYVFTRDGDAWVLQATLQPDDAPSGANVGSSVAIAGDTVVAGARNATLGDNFYQGAAYVFVRDGAAWSQQAKLTAADGAGFDHFGTSVALSGDSLVVGAPEARVDQQEGQGAVYVFARNGAAWGAPAKLTAADGGAFDAFGESVVLEGDRLLVGAPGDDSRSVRNDTVYAFDRDGDGWTPGTSLSAADANAFDFGGSVAVKDGVILVGARLAAGPKIYGNPNEGRAYLFGAGAAEGTPCAQGADCASGFCTDGVCCHEACDSDACDTCATPGHEGTCLPAPVGTECRASAGDCDVAETCDGQSKDCPADALRSVGHECRPSVGACDAAETCDGTGPDCPADVVQPAGHECRPSAGACDVAETCDGHGTDCPADGVQPAGHECRPSAGACDAAETCDGVAAACPPDGVQPAGHECRSSAGACDAAETCDGVAAACPVDRVQAVGHECRPSAGACDVAETCDGVAAACPPDGLRPAGFECRAATCADGVEATAGRCTGVAATCPDSPPRDCGAYVCGPSTCLDRCATNDDCAGGRFCVAGVCTGLRSNGEPCRRPGECASSFCVDGFCCESRCGGQCEACGEAGHEGECVAASGAPRGDRAACATDGSACGGACDGARRDACAFPGAETGCRDGSCFLGTATLAATCDGRGACPPEETQDCAPFLCGVDACAGDCTADADCGDGSFCRAGVCVPLLERGERCAADAHCLSGHCVDGYCCSGGCDGQCEACDVAGFEGTCTPLEGAPHGDRAACAGLGVCAGRCDGRRRETCAYPGPGVTCLPAACHQGVAATTATCDGAGACAEGQVTSCGDYACGADACLDRCAGDRDCADGRVCVDGACGLPAVDAGAPASDAAVGADAAQSGGGNGGCRAVPFEGGAGPALLAVAGLLRRRRRRRM